MTGLNDDSAQYLISTVRKDRGLNRSCQSLGAPLSGCNTFTYSRWTSGLYRSGYCAFKITQSGYSNGHSISQNCPISLDDLNKLLKNEPGGITKTFSSVTPAATDRL